MAKILKSFISDDIGFISKLRNTVYLKRVMRNFYMTLIISKEGNIEDFLINTTFDVAPLKDCTFIVSFSMLQLLQEKDFLSREFRNSLQDMLIKYNLGWILQ